MGEVALTPQDVDILLGLPIDGHALISDCTLGPGMSWIGLVASIFGHALAPTRFNGYRLQLRFFSSITPGRLSDVASAEEVLLHTRCYLVHIIGGVLFTDHFGGSIHPMYLLFLRDLDMYGDYAWGAAVLAFLYREPCKGCNTDKEEVVGCLLLLQLWAWERLPTLAPIRLNVPLHDSRLWDGQLASPYGAW
ncbi:protein MAIN-LIKE 2-like [Daucus carota subsp. sativus]|uniref:protein MAIN-LIKE 2-like n=1 Tax=Daucus carota subsp. sativus TaxID=79200 RepID=UPI0007EF60A4|nr:PREDICTED: serine/threonine-protein phosphatase 7 long form homolog [Daucus carota subsp. sativus]